MKKLFVYILLCLMVQGADAQKMRNVFVSMPDSVMPMLSKVNREDCIDFVDSKMKAIVKNNFGEQSEMVALTGDYMKMNLSKRSSFELKLLQLADSTKVLCMISTVGDSLKQSSSVSFYTPDWKKKLKRTDFIKLPQISEYMVQRPDSVSEDDYKRKEQKIDVFLQSASFTTDGNIDFTLNMGEMNSEDRDMVAPYVVDKLEYKWNNKNFAKKD